jgi:uncharacterized protein
MRNTDSKRRVVWIDVDNSPHVPLFVPIIKHFRSQEVSVILTARDHSQTIELLDLHGLGGTYEIIGKHYGGNKINKLYGLFARARQLARYIRKSGVKPAVAISHGSRSMVLAGRWLKVPIITMYDYEHTETSIFNRLSDRVLVPAAIPDKVLDSIGLKSNRRKKHQGLKEEVYLRHFAEDPEFRERLASEIGLSLGDRTVLVVLRPPATTANYHDPKSEELFREILDHINHSDNTAAVIVPRTVGQKRDIEHLIAEKRYPGDRFAVLKHAVSGLDLADAADLMISGGGTMNREAVLLGVPVYSIFSGKLGSIDARMEEDGLIIFIRQPADVSKIKLRQRRRSLKSRPVITDRVERFVTEQINSFLNPA